MKAKHIRREIALNENDVTEASECVSCGKKQTPIDIATQGVQEPSAGMHCCQTCLCIAPEDIAPQSF